MDERVLIFGGSSVTGKALVASLKRKLFAPNASFCNITNQEEVQKTIFDYKPTVVVNLAERSNPDHCEQHPELAFAINSHALINIGSSCAGLENPPYVIHLSTNQVFDGTSYNFYSEESLPRPVNVYGESKLQGERVLAKQAELGRFKLCIVRSGWIYGFWKDDYLHGLFRSLKDRPDSGFGVTEESWGVPTFANDLALFMIELMDARYTGLINYTNQSKINVSWYMFVSSVVAIAKEVTGSAFYNPERIVPATIRKSFAMVPKFVGLDLTQSMQFGVQRNWLDAVRFYVQGLEKDGII